MVEHREKENIDINNVFRTSSSVKIEETDRLRLGKQVLFGLFLITIIVIFLYVRNPNNSAIKEVFDFYKIGVLPLVTLVISFYFPSKSN